MFTASKQSHASETKPVTRHTRWEAPNGQPIETTQTLPQCDVHFETNRFVD